MGYVNKASLLTLSTLKAGAQLNPLEIFHWKTDTAVVVVVAVVCLLVRFVPAAGRVSVCCGA